MGEVMKEAAFSLAEAKFATGDFNQVVLQNVTKAQIKIRTKKDNVAGMYRFYTYNLLIEILIKWQVNRLA
jgi:vacuolar-type H+-ATPase subunit D/Vma8